MQPWYAVISRLPPSGAISTMTSRAISLARSFPIARWNAWTMGIRTPASILRRSRWVMEALVNDALSGCSISFPSRNEPHHGPDGHSNDEPFHEEPEVGAKLRRGMHVAAD